MKEGRKEGRTDGKKEEENTIELIPYVPHAGPAIGRHLPEMVLKSPRGWESCHIVQLVSLEFKELITKPVMVTYTLFHEITST